MNENFQQNDLTQNAPDQNAPQQNESLSGVHRERNRQSRALWSDFAGHRRHVTRLITEQASVREPKNPAARLLILGAGNCQDVELPQLLNLYHEIALVDIDVESVRAGIARQNCRDDRRLRVIGPHDLSGIEAELTSHSVDRPPTRDQLRRLCDVVERATLPTPSDTYDVVASTCLLSQMIDAVRLRIDEREPGFWQVVEQLRRRHLEQLVDAAAPGGVALLISDVVSSSTAPGLESTPPEELPAYVRTLIERRNFFTGLNPVILVNLFRSEPSLVKVVDRAQLLPPWKWRFGDRVYAVCAIRGQKKRA